MPGDVFAAVDGRAMDAAGLKTAVAARKSGDHIRVLVRRGGADWVVDVALDPRMERSWRLMTVPQPSAPQAAIFAGWTAVTVK